jgi:hypothetical protein
VRTRASNPIGTPPPRKSWITPAYSVIETLLAKSDDPKDSGGAEAAPLARTEQPQRTRAARVTLRWANATK